MFTSALRSAVAASLKPAFISACVGPDAAAVSCAGADAAGFDAAAGAGEVRVIVAGRAGAEVAVTTVTPETSGAGIGAGVERSLPKRIARTAPRARAMTMPRKGAKRVMLVRYPKNGILASSGRGLVVKRLPSKQQSGVRFSPPAQRSEPRFPV